MPIVRAKCNQYQLKLNKSEIFCVSFIYFGFQMHPKYFSGIKHADYSYFVFGSFLVEISPRRKTEDGFFMVFLSIFRIIMGWYAYVKLGHYHFLSCPFLFIRISQSFDVCSLRC